MTHRNAYMWAAVTATWISTAASLAADRWKDERAWEWYKKLPWLVGFNYVPSTACNTTEFWQAETFDPTTIKRELGWAAEIGFNTCRVFVQFLVWKHDPEGLKARFDQFLALADRHRITVVPVLFDDCTFGDPPATEPYLGKQKDPIPGMVMPSWTPSPGLGAVTDRSARPDLERYVKDMVGRFGRDRRVVFWDLYNEPGNSNMGDKSLPLVKEAFKWAREVTHEQPLTIGVWTGSLGNLNTAQIESSDVITFHAYTNYDGLRGSILGYMKQGRPLICTEWMARLQGSNWESDLPLLKDERIGCYSWGLVNGRTQTQFAWNSRRGSPEPKVWFHDLFHVDGMAYSPSEVAAIRRITQARKLEPLFDFPLRDTVVCLANGIYYLTGTTGHPTWWQTNDGIRIWKSADLKKWEPLGLVWTFEKNGTWQKKVVNGKRAIWAPELHFIKGTFWIAYCVNYGGTGILKSTTGRIEGPYLDVKIDGPLTGEIDASLFMDDNGKVYFVYQNGKIARMKDDLTGLAEDPRLLKPVNANQVGFEGAFLFKANGRYFLSCAEFGKEREYHCMVASSQNLMGPYGNRYLTVRHGGHNMFFKDEQGRWWSTFFGNDPHAAFRERPGILRVDVGEDGVVQPIRP